MRWTTFALPVLLLAGCAKPPEDVPQAQVAPVTAPAPAPAADEHPAAAPAMARLELTEGEVGIDAAASRFEFEGYGPGKSHLGKFSSFDAALRFEGENLVGARGVIDPSTVDTGIGKLDAHLKNEDFFDVTAYPAIVVESTSIEQTGESATVTGKLTFHGVTHEVTFPATVKDGVVSADFRLDTTPFGMKHAGVNKEVRIMFELKPAA